MKYGAYKNEFWNEKTSKTIFKELPFYNAVIKKKQELSIYET